MPASDTRALALTRVRSGGSSRGTAAARVTPYALDATRHAQRGGEQPRGLGDDGGGQHPAEERAGRHGRADRPSAAVAEAVEERADQRRDDRERQHRQAEEQGHLAARLAGGHLEEQGAGQRDRDGRVAGGVEGVELDQPGQPGVAGALGPCRPSRLGDGVVPGGAGAPPGHPGPVAGGLRAPSGRSRPARGARQRAAYGARARGEAATASRAACPPRIAAPTPVPAPARRTGRGGRWSRVHLGLPARQPRGRRPGPGCRRDRTAHRLS